MAHAEIENLLCQAVEGGEVLVAENETNVPILWIGLGSVQEDAVAFNQPRLLFCLPYWFDVRFQVFHERVEASGQDLAQGDAGDSALCVLVLSHRRRDGE